jgi:hypothetical protein
MRFFKSKPQLTLDNVATLLASAVFVAGAAAPALLRALYTPPKKGESVSRAGQQAQPEEASARFIAK